MSDATATDQEISDFVRGYDRPRWDRLKFAWNGQHAKDFEDAGVPSKLRGVGGATRSQRPVAAGGC